MPIDLPPKPPMHAVYERLESGLIAPKKRKFGVLPGITVPLAGFAASAPDPSITIEDQRGLDGAGPNYSFTNVSYGPNTGNRRLIVLGYGYTNNSYTTNSWGWTTFTVSGAQATLLKAQNGQTTQFPRCAIYKATPSGTSGTIACTVSFSTQFRFGIIVLALRDFPGTLNVNYSGSDYHTSTSDTSMSFTPSGSGGAGVAIATCYVAGTTSQYTWSGLTEHFDGDPGGTYTDNVGVAWDFPKTNASIGITTTGSTWWGCSCGVNLSN